MQIPIFAPKGASVPTDDRTAQRASGSSDFAEHLGVVTDTTSIDGPDPKVKMAQPLASDEASQAAEAKSTTDPTAADTNLGAIEEDIEALLKQRDSGIQLQQPAANDTEGLNRDGQATMALGDGPRSISAPRRGTSNAGEVTLARRPQNDPAAPAMPRGGTADTSTTDGPLSSQVAAKQAPPTSDGTERRQADMVPTRAQQTAPSADQEVLYKLPATKGSGEAAAVAKEAKPVVPQDASSQAQKTAIDAQKVVENRPFGAKLSNDVAAPHASGKTQTPLEPRKEGPHDALRLSARAPLPQSTPGVEQQQNALPKSLAQQPGQSALPDPSVSHWRDILPPGVEKRIEARAKSAEASTRAMLETNVHATATAPTVQVKPIMAVNPVTNAARLDTGGRAAERHGETSIEFLATHSSAPSSLAPAAQVSVPQALPQRADVYSIMRQIGDATARGRDGAIEIRLSPEELGTVRMRMVPTELGIMVHVQADQAETLDLLRRNAEGLAAELARHGSHAAGFSFGDGADPQAREERRPSVLEGAPDPSTTSPTTDPHPTSVAASGSVDIRL